MEIETDALGAQTTAAGEDQAFLSFDSLPPFSRGNCSIHIHIYIVQRQKCLVR